MFSSVFAIGKRSGMAAGIAALLCSPANGHAQATEPIVVKTASAKATVLEAEDPSGVARVKVAVESNGTSAGWTYDNLWLDPEETGAPVAEVVAAKDRELLVVHSYSGGAGCCWSLLLFDISHRTALGERLASQSPIKLSKAREGDPCLFTAVIRPVRAPGKEPTPSRLCFDGKQFVPAAR